MARIILVANTDWYLYNFRLSLAQLLRARGHDVLLVSPAGRFVEHIRQEGFQWLEWAVGRSSANLLGENKAVNALARLYRTEKPDLVHHFTVKPVLYGSLAAHRARVPAVVNAVTGLGYVFRSAEARARLLRPLVAGAFYFTLRLSGSEVIFENQADRDFFIRSRLARTERANLIESAGVDTVHFTPVREPPGTPVVVLPARMLWDKGVGVLVDAGRLLKERLPVRLVLVGEPDAGNPSSIDLATLHGWVEEGVVEWWGWQANMKSVYARSHIVTLPSMHEGAPTVLLEAAASGRPIVASDIPGCRGIVHPGENGLLVPVSDAAALADALETLARDADLRARMGAAGRRLVEDHFSDENVNQATLAVYQKAAARAGVKGI